jgi:hypothetical protein
MTQPPQSRLEFFKQTIDIAVGKSVFSLPQINQHPATHQHLSNLRDIKKNLLDSAGVYASASDNRDVILSGEPPAKKFSLYVHSFRLLREIIRTRQISVLTLGDNRLTAAVIWS